MCERRAAKLYNKDIASIAHHAHFRAVPYCDSVSASVSCRLFVLVDLGYHLRGLLVCVRWGLL